MSRRISSLATRCRSHGPTSILHLATVTASREGRASSSMAFAEPARQRTDKTKAGEHWLPGFLSVANWLRRDPSRMQTSAVDLAESIGKRGCWWWDSNPSAEAAARPLHEPF